jgi:hypothetical protein
MKEMTAVLSSPRLQGTKLTYNVRVLDGGLSASGGATSLFIDDPDCTDFPPAPGCWGG